MHWSPVDRNLIASGDEKGTVVLWNISSGETWNWQPDFSNCHIFCLAFSPRAASLLAVGSVVGCNLFMTFCNLNNVVKINVSQKEDKFLIYSIS